MLLVGHTLQANKRAYSVFFPIFLPPYGLNRKAGGLCSDSTKHMFSHCTSRCLPLRQLFEAKQKYDLIQRALFWLAQGRSSENSWIASDTAVITLNAILLCFSAYNLSSLRITIC